MQVASATGKHIIEEIKPAPTERTPLDEKGSHIFIDTTSHTPDDIVTLKLKSLEEKYLKNTTTLGL